jgi:cyclopropane fatty-acyl-phospholipid synthase-like methyltransferase
VDLKPEAISDEQLTTLQNVVQAINKLKMDIGQVEAQKHNMLHTLTQGNEQLSKIQSEIKDEYGENIDVNINDGSIRYNENEPSDS